MRHTLGPLSRRNVDPEFLAECATITPTCIAKLHNIDYTPTTSPVNGSGLAIASFLEQYIKHTDITSFISKYGISNSTRTSQSNFTVELVNNDTNNEKSAGIEAKLDVEYSMPFTSSLLVVFYSVGSGLPSLDVDRKGNPANQSSNEPYLEWLE